MKLYHFVLAIIALFLSATEALARGGGPGPVSNWKTTLFFIAIIAGGR